MGRVRAHGGRVPASEIDPSILGTLFERGLDPGKRAQLGAHYTDREKTLQSSPWWSSRTGLREFTRSGLRLGGISSMYDQLDIPVTLHERQHSETVCCCRRA